MGDPNRFEIFRENHIGFGIRWRSDFFWLELSIAFPFFCIVIGIGKRKVG